MVIQARRPNNSCWYLRQQDYRERMLSIRPATPDDAPEIAHVHVESWRTTYAGIVPDEYLAALNEADRATMWREQLSNNLEVSLANLDGEVVGFITGGPIREPIQSYDAELYAIYLLQPAQGQGIGRRFSRNSPHRCEAKASKAWLCGCSSKIPQNISTYRTGAQLLTSKEIEIGGATLTEVAYGWPDLKLLERRL